jgi:hypothetical protein
VWPSTIETRGPRVRILLETQIYVFSRFCIFRFQYRYGLCDGLILEDYIFLQVWPLNGSRNSSVGIVIGYGLGDRGFGVRVLVGARIFSSQSSPDRL